MVIEIYSVLLLMTCGAAVACGLYASHGNEVRLNRLFLLICGTVVVWAFGLALAGAAQTEQISAIGRRVAPLGWGTIAGVTMHSVLVLTGRDVLLKKRRTYFLLYLPSFVTVFAYTLLPLFGLNPDTPVRTDFGWVNASETDGWDWFFYSYTIVYIFIAAVLLLRWGEQSSSGNEKKQVKIISYSFLTATVLGYVTDVLPAFLQIRFPQVAAIFMLVLIFAVGYCINRYHFLQPVTISQDELILSKSARTHVYKYLGLAVFGCGVILLIGKPLFAVYSASLPAGVVIGLLFLAAIFLIAIEHLRLAEKAKEMMVSLTFAFLIPFMTLWFSDIGIYTSWAFVFLLMIICLLFNRLIILTCIISSSFFTQLFEWGYMPTASITVSWQSYSARLGIIVFAALFAFYVNKIYTSRLRENINHVAMQSIASEISHSFVSTSEQNIDNKLYAALERCGRFIQCDRAYLVLLDTESNTVRHAVEWISEAAGSARNNLDDAMRNIRPEMLKQFSTSNALVLKDTRRMPLPAAKIGSVLLAQGIRALVTVPVRNKGEIIGFLGFNASRPLAAWNFDSITFIEIVGRIVSDAVIKANGERELNYLAYHDQLTGLPNRTLFKEKLSDAIRHAEKTQKMIGAVFLDLDAFKSVNDTLGHDQGDRLLIEVSKALTKAVRDRDTVARFGGDEFILMLNQLSSKDELVRIMDRLMDVIQKPVTLAEQEFFVSVSAGVAVYPQDGNEPEILLKNADLAMFKAKCTGKSRYVLCTQEMKNEILEKAQLTNLLYNALEKNQFILHYQPQVDISTRTIVGLEALIRWDLPERGIISPAAFIPLAEQTGLIYAIGEWVMREACIQNRRWRDMGYSDLRMAVNVSVQQLRNSRFIQTVEDTLRETGLPARYLELEITESVTNGNTDNIVAVLHRLKALGVSISIDDFGTEYSSLSRLKFLPVDRIKIDMQFVQGIERSDKDRAISKVIINLARSLRLKVIAEGVETASQLDFLSRGMCDEIQGYYYYKPMPAEEVEGVFNRLITHP